MTFEQLYQFLDTSAKKSYPRSEFVQSNDPWHDIRHMRPSEVFPSLEVHEDNISELNPEFTQFKWSDSCKGYMGVCMEDFIGCIEENKNR